ncbi:hypothetical protein OROMI_020622 [Orobanche minor]
MFLLLYFYLPTNRSKKFLHFPSHMASNTTMNSV